MRQPLRIAGLLLVPFALALAACGECDCEKHKKTPDAGGTPVEKASAATPAEVEAARKGPSTDAPPTPPVVAQAWRGEGTTLELSVWHMRCGGCEKKVEDAIKALPGVKDVVATNADSKVVVTLADASQREAVKPQIAETLAALDFQLLGK
jgi:copper chaperone CopZ